MKVFITLLTILLSPMLHATEGDSNETASFFADQSKKTVLATDAVKKDFINKETASTLDLKQIFFTAPIIYSILLCMSVISVVLWLFSLFSLRSKRFLPESFADNMKLILSSHKYSEALECCKAEDHVLAKITKVGILSRHFGPQVVFDSMKSEGKRSAASFWQRISLLNDIVTIAPMLGLLGTVIGMFYAFYDVNRSVESITALFDGLGIAVGTTVCGLLVSILSMAFYTSLKHRLVKLFSIIEAEALTIGCLIKKDEEKKSFTKSIRASTTRKKVEEKS